MTNRVHELQDIHGWSAEELAFALKLIDEPLPFYLHTAGARSVASKSEPGY